MFVKLCALLIVFAAVAANAAPTVLLREVRQTNVENVQVSDSEWTEYKNKFGKIYPDEVEEAERRAIYLEKKKFVEAHNQKYKEGKVTFSVGINQFSDRKPEETKNRLGLISPRNRQTET